MEFNMKLKNLQESCRVCLQKGDLNIWDNRVKPALDDDMSLDLSMELPIIELIQIFHNSESELLELSAELPLICYQCLEDIRLCYIFYNKLKEANTQLKSLFHEAIEQFIEEEQEEEEEYLMENDAELDKIDTNDTIDNLQDIINVKEELPAIVEEIENVVTEETKKKVQQIVQNRCHRSFKPREKRIKTKMSLDANSSLILTHFVPSSLNLKENSQSQKINATVEDTEDFRHIPKKLLNVDYKAVEIKDLSNLELIESNFLLQNNSIAEAATAASNNTQLPVYICQYCPQAFSNVVYLKTHIQTSHVCKFCTQAFAHSKDLFQHVRNQHNEHKCAICQKAYSSNTNLRYHQRKIHGLKIPAKMAIIDFIPNDSSRNSMELTHGAHADQPIKHDNLNVNLPPHDQLMEIYN